MENVSRDPRHNIARRRHKCNQNYPFDATKVFSPHWNSRDEVPVRNVLATDWELQQGTEESRLRSTDQPNEYKASNMRSPEKKPALHPQTTQSRRIRIFLGSSGSPVGASIAKADRRNSCVTDENPFATPHIFFRSGVARVNSRKATSSLASASR